MKKELPSGVKVCRECLRILNTSLFSKDKRYDDGFRFNCKECRNRYEKALRDGDKEYRKRQNLSSLKWAKKNRIKLNEYKVKWSKRLPDEVRRSNRYKNEYGITLDDFNKLNYKQGGECLICSKKPKLLCVDHCHSTGRVRGLLCRQCNMMIGLGKDSKAIFKKAIECLEKI